MVSTVVKTTHLILFLAAAAVFGAEETWLPPLKAIEQWGSISISDGSSYFTFARDGSFHSGPFGASGHTLDGHWTARDETMFTVIATAGWENGEAESEDYRRIVFDIRNLQKRPRLDKPVLSAPIQLFEGYFIIRELVKIPKPGDEFPK
jgi:hypothetical protein